MSLAMRATAAVGFILAFAGFSSAVNCGDFITSNTVLTADLTCDCVTFNIFSALAVVGPATLDLNGHKVSCTDMESFCLTILGDGATVKNGIVTACFAGVGNFGGFGNAIIKDVTAHATNIGLYLSESDNNMILNVTVKDNADAGIIVIGNNNLVKDSYAGRQQFEGIAFSGDNNTALSNTVEDSSEYSCMGTAPIDDVSPGTPDRNVFKNNTIRRCNGFGVYVYANNSTVADNKFYFTAGTSIFASFEGNTITRNSITGSGNDGIGLTSGERMVVAGNLIVNSAKDGIDLQPESIRCTVKDNTVNKCGSEGVQVRGDFHIITGNKITKCLTGIEAIVGADNNRLTNNKVSGSTLFDLSDLSANCGSNIWNGNTKTGNIACTKN